MWVECNGVCVTLGKSVNPSLLELHQLAIVKNNPHLCDFIETHYLKEVKFVKNWVTTLPACARWGPPKSVVEDYLLDKHALGDSDES